MKRQGKERMLNCLYLIKFNLVWHLHAQYLTVTIKIVTLRDWNRLKGVR